MLAATDPATTPPAPNPVSARPPAMAAGAATPTATPTPESLISLSKFLFVNSNLSNA